MKKIIIKLLLVAVGIIGVYWLSTHAFVEISVPSGAGGEITYSLRDQRRQRTAEIKTSASTIKRIVRRGSHEVLVKQSETSYFAVVKAGSFLMNTKVLATLSPEKSRQFVGNNPGPCMHYFGKVLMSRPCDDFHDGVVFHLPATADKPTSSRKLVDFIKTAVFEDSIRFKGSDLVLWYELRLQEGLHGIHTLYDVKNGVEFANGTTLAGTDDEKRYSLDEYQDGFLAYDNNFNDFLYYTGAGAEPNRLQLQRSAAKDFVPYALGSQGDTVAVAYTHRPRDVRKQKPNSERKGEIIIKNKDTSKVLSFKKSYDQVRLCGQNRLCLLVDKQLEIYDTSGQKAKLLFRVDDVGAAEYRNDVLLIARTNELLSLNLENRAGSAEYGYGGYKFCGLEAGADHSTLCLVNNLGRRVALRVDSSAVNKDSIDKKILELSGLSEVKEVSIYDNLITISPELGESKYIEELGIFWYEQSLIDSVNKKINDEINRLGFDRGVYKITNTFED